MELAAVLSLFAVLSGTLASVHHGTKASQESYQNLVPELLSRMTTLERKLDESKATEEILLQEIEKLKSENVVQQNQIRELQTLMEAEHRTDEADDTLSGPDPISQVDANKRPAGRIKQLPRKPEAPLPTRSLPYRRFLIAEAGTPIAFSAYMDHDSNNLGKGQNIVFNKVLLNDGSGYNQHTGIFTCPINGVYLFSFFVGSRDTMQIYANLVINSSNTIDAVAEGTQSMQDLQGGNVVIVRLTQGDAVRVTAVIGNHVEGAQGVRITSFTGALLYY